MPAVFWQYFFGIKLFLVSGHRLASGQHQRPRIRPEQPETVASGVPTEAAERLQQPATELRQLRRMGPRAEESGNQTPEPLPPVLLQPH